MLKLLGKKGKDNKGFTLIELIVVIAIIAILALILVPNFGNFTENARVSNDKNACVTIEKAFMTLIANGTYKVPAEVTITIDEDGDFAYGSGQLRNSDNTADVPIETVETEITNLTGDIEIQAKDTHNNFTVTIETNGEVTCTVS